MIADQVSARDQSSVVHAFRVVRERWWIVAAVTLVALALSIASALSGEKEYSATAKLLTRNSGLDALVSGSSSFDDVDPTRRTATNLAIVGSRAVAERVARELRLDASPEDLLAQVDAQAVPESDVIEITAVAADPKQAAQIATAFAFGFKGYRQQTQRAAIEQGAELLRKRLEAVPESQAAERQRLEQSLSQVVSLAAVQTGDAEVIDRAEVPGAASSPRPRRDAMVGLLLGLVLGIALAFLADLFDRRLKRAEDIEQEYGYDTLTTIPVRARAPRTTRERQAELEPFRILRTALGFLAADRPIQSVVVTSAVAGEGKTTVAAGLARAIALSGQRVVLVECDLRKPSLRRHFDLGDDPRGLTSALIGASPLHDLVRTPIPGLSNLLLLPSGPLPPNSTELLRGGEMARVLAELRATADFVIIDAPPLLPVADTHVLLELDGVDAALLVARAYRTRRDEAARARGVLSRHPRVPKGLVVNGVRELDAGYDYYGAEASGSGASRGKAGASS